MLPKNAKAFSGGSSSVTIGSITFSDYDTRVDNKVFNGNVLVKLYDKILGNTGAAIGTGTLNDIKSAVNRGNLDSQQLDNGNIVLDFGGYRWNAVYLTKNSAGDPVLTLWLDGNSLTNAQYSYATTNYLPNGKYPSNMYSVTQMRVVTLNGGGDTGTTYANGLNSLAAPLSDAQRLANPWAQFTLSSAKIGRKSLTDYIVQPKDIAYQQDENVCNLFVKSGTRDPYMLPNEALGVPAPTIRGNGQRWYIRSPYSYNFSGIDTSISGGIAVTASNSTDTPNTYVDGSRYAEWGEDYLWLPSVSETGCQGWLDEPNSCINGIWNTTILQKEGSAASFVRSAMEGNTNWTYVLSATGGINQIAPEGMGAVRPALHLNLAACENSVAVSQPTIAVDANGNELQFVYDGNLQTYVPNGYLPAYMDITGNTETDADSYKVTVVPKSNYAWTDNTSTPAEFNFVINKAIPTVNPKLDVTGLIYITDKNLPLLKLSPGDTAGMVQLKAGQKLKAGNNEYDWEYVPTDTKNYNNSVGKIRIQVESVQLATIKVVKFNDSGEDIYTTTTANGLKNLFEIEAVYNNGQTLTLSNSDPDLSILIPNNQLVAGNNTVTISYDGEMITYPVNDVIQADITQLFATYKSDGTEITPNTPLDDLKQCLKVTAMLNIGKSQTIYASDYTLSGTLTAGKSKITVTYTDTNNTVFTADFEVTVIDKNNPGGINPGGPAINYLPVPNFNDLKYTGSEIDVLNGYANLNIVTVTGNKQTVVGKYTVELTLTDANYCWQAASVTGTAYKNVSSATISADGKTVKIDWQIIPATLTADWNKNGTLVITSDSYTGSYDGIINYKYFDNLGNEVAKQDLKKGQTYKVMPSLLDTNNFELDANTKQLFDVGGYYTVPQSGAAAFFGNVKEFMTKSWLGLPVWSWFLIALALLILLIIIIVVACKRRKSKEEREEKKRQKEEEKERREEERRQKEEERAEEKRRRDEEREAEKERQKAELELAKAKQEAELAKMKAEAAAAAGIGAAGVAMAAQPQQPVQQAMPQPQYNADPNVLAEIKAELAEIKARQNMEMQYRQTPIMQMPVQQPMMQMPMQMPNYGPMPQYGNNNVGGNNMNDPVMFAEITRLKAENEAHMKSELDRARTESERAKADAEIAKIRAESGQYAPRIQPPQENVYQIQSQDKAPQAFSAEMLGSIIGGVLKELNVPLEKEKVQKVTVEEQTKPATVDSPTVYPADAVVTTTTTVDTTKNKTAPRSLRSDDGRLFDIDGFYDTFEGK